MDPQEIQKLIDRIEALRKKEAQLAALEDELLRRAKEMAAQTQYLAAADGIQERLEAKDLERLP